MTALSSTSLFSALAAKMRWHQARQQVLAENIANAETPGYTERDLKPFELTLDSLNSSASVTMSGTSPNQIHVASQGGGFEVESAPDQVSPGGNGVTLEDEMMKVSMNDVDYQTVAALYTRSMRLIRVALGKTV
ncbi:MAG: flagellar basal body rod protein FlgB [Devosia sp.]